MHRALLVFLLTAAAAVAQDPTPAKADAPVAKKKQPEAIARIAEIEIKLSPSEDPFASNPFGPQQLNHYGFLQFVKRAARDPNLDGIILKPKSYGVGYARLFEVRDALKRLRRSGKKVFVYKESMAAPDLILASVADRISVPESGSVFLPGIAIESLYMRGMLAKLHLKMEVIHIGEYKSAGEQFYRDSMSKELKESLDPILDEFFESMVSALAESRGLTASAVKGAIDKGIMSAKEAQRIGLIDRVEYYDQFKEGVKAFFPGKKVKRAGDYSRKSKFDLDTDNPLAAFSTLMSLFAPQKTKLPKGPKIAVVYCTGAIVSGKSQYDWSGNIAAMGSETIVKAIDKARKNKDVKAIVLRINSPGGSGLASDMIWRAVERAKEAGKVIISSMGDVAASGGYFIAMNSDQILAEPQTITGSIGVVGMSVNADDFWPWVGITPQRLTRGARSAAFMTSKAFTDEDKTILRNYMKDFYGDFVAKVAAGRGKTPAEIEPIARGRIWTGRAALKNGLIDRLGGIEDAIALARERGGIPADAKAGTDFHILEYPRRAGPFEALEKMFGGESEARMALSLGLNAAMLERVPQLRQVLSRLSVLRAMSRDRICVVNTELAGFETPFASTSR